MGLVQKFQRWIRGTEPTLVDYEQAEQQGHSIDASDNAVLGKVGPNMNPNAVAPAPGGTWKMQQSYDALLQTVQDLRSALDGQSRRQDELLNKIGTLPQAAEVLPQTSKMQNDMLKIINDRLSAHADQQRKVNEVAAGLGPLKKEYAEALQSIREQIEMGNEIDRQLVESFNRFSMMLDRLQNANQHAVEALQQVRDSHAASAMQMHEWIEKSRHRNSWLIGGAFLMAAASLIIVLILIYNLMAH